MYAPQETQKSEEYCEVKRTKSSAVDYEYQQMQFFCIEQKNMYGYLNNIVQRVIYVADSFVTLARVGVPLELLYSQVFCALNIRHNKKRSQLNGLLLN